MILILFLSRFSAIYTPKLAIISEIHHSAHRESLTKKISITSVFPFSATDSFSSFTTERFFSFYHGLNG